MKYKMLMFVILFIFVSGCVASEDVLKQLFKVEAIGGEAEDITINAEFPSFAKQGREFGWKLEVIPAYDIEDFNLEVTDRCPLVELVGESQEKWGPYPKIDAGRMKILSTRYKVIPDVPFERECKIKFKADYNSSVSLIQGISVLEMAEYEIRETEGTLGEIESFSSKTENPLDIKISFSEEQPFIDGDEIYMYIDYENRGDGFIDSLERGNIIVKFPNNLDFIECDDYVKQVVYRDCYGNKISVDTNKDGKLDEFEHAYTMEEVDPLQFIEENGGILLDLAEAELKIYADPDYKGIYIPGKKRVFKYHINDKIEDIEKYCVNPFINEEEKGLNEVLATDRILLNKPLKFYNNKAKRSTCKFKTKMEEEQVINTGSINLNAKYNYKIYGEVAKDGKGIEIRK